MVRDLKHQVWHVYDEYRSARLTIRYYCCVLEKTRRRNLALEVMIGLVASGSAVAALTVWQTAAGTRIWQALSVVVAALAVAKPMLKYDARMQQLQELISGYRVIEHSLKKLVIAIEERRQYDAELQERFATALDDIGNLSAKSLNDPIDEQLRRECREAVERELPAEHFFVPRGEQAP